MLHLHLVRHGEKASDPDILTSRSPGVGLTPRGREQAIALANALGKLRLSRLLSSPLERAIETAKPLAHASGLNLEIEPAFNEMDFGEWTNRRCSDLQSLPSWRDFNQHRRSVRTPGGESMADVQSRFLAGLDAVRANTPDGDVVIVSHEDPIKSVLLHFLNTSLDDGWRLTIAPASISTIAFDGPTARILCINL